MKKKIWIASILAGLSVTAAIGGVSVVQEQPFITAAAETWTVDKLDSKYLYGTVFNAPAATVEVGGKTATATASVTYPDGLVTTAENVKLNKEGTYTVTYRAEVDGVHCVEEKYFNVEAKAYLTQKEESSVVFDSYTGHGANVDGLIVRLAKNDTLTFSQLIDFETLSSTQPLVDMFVTPDSLGERDFAKLTFRYTDALDDSYYMEFKLVPYDVTDRGINTSYVAVSTNGQDFKGLEGAKYSDRGTPATHSFVSQRHVGDAWSGDRENLIPGTFTVGFFYNTETTEASTKYWNGSPRNVAFLNDLTIFEEAWTGFPSGQARLSITADEYSAKTANFVIKSIYGIKDLSQTWFDEDGLPELTIALDEEELPKGQVGAAYKIPEATAFDYYTGVCDVKTSVYRDYSTGDKISVGVSGGKFTPTIPGWYTIVYTAEDMLGNCADELRNVYVSADLGKITVTVPEDKMQEAVLGQFVPVSAATYTGDSGLSTMKIVASLGEEQYEITDGFIPETEGEWKVTYVVTDYLGRVGTGEYTVTATKTTQCRLMDKLALSQIYISGQEYQLPEMYAKDYSTGKGEEKLCDVVVKDANGEKTYKAGDVFTPTVEENGAKIEIIYQCNGQILEKKEIPTIIAVAKGKISGINYLYGTGFTASFKDKEENFLDNGIMVTANEEADRCGFTFANPQLWNDFVVELQGVKADTTFSSIEITLVDALNEDVAISLNLKAKEGGATVTSGGVSLEDATTIVTDTSYKVSFKNGRFYFGDVSIKADTMVNGEAFEGFSSDLVYVRVEMIKAQKGSAFKILAMNRSNLSRRNLEAFKPIISVRGDLSGERDYNDIFEIFPAIAHDTFAPNTSITLTVTAPDGSVVVDSDGVKLENVAPDKSYFITLSAYGKFKVTYEAVEKDWIAENKLTYIVTVFVVDDIAPQAYFTNAVQTTAKVGDTIVMPDVAVRDNFSPVEEISISRGVLCPNRKYWRFKDNENAILCAQEGDYTFLAYVYDERGNYVMIRHTITVTK